MPKKRVTPKTLPTVLRSIESLAAADNEDAKVLCDAIEVMLDDLAGNDFFGTEGQNDPRGDQRE